MALKEDIRKEIEYITNQIIKKYNPKKIILFGSASYGKFSEDSDIDLFIIKDDSRDGRERIYDVIGMFEHNLAIDVIVYTPKEVAQCLKWKDPFVKKIIESGKVLYGR